MTKQSILLPLLLIPTLTLAADLQITSTQLANMNLTTTTVDFRKSVATLN